MTSPVGFWPGASAFLLAFSFVFSFGATAVQARGAPHDTLVPFRSDDELLRYLKKARRVQRREMMDGAVSEAMPSPPPAAPAAADKAASTTPSQSITNTQEANVDEGGIVKMHGDTLVILRRGRLFTVSTRRGDLRPIDYINAFPPGVDPSSDWYDEMLVAGDRVIVIGFSYGRGGTEINRFHISGDGHLAFEDAYHLRSNDYYSSRNYASRLVGTKLIVYSPLYLPYGEVNSFDWLPGLRKWNGDAHGGFERIVSANQIYIPRPWRDAQEIEIAALHTVTSCDLAATVLHCNATSVLGPAGRNFYVSAKAVYVWVTEPQWGGRDTKAAPSLLYRLPLDGSAPSAIGVRGAPTDQFSFREDFDEGVLNVLVHAEGAGDAMWMPEFAQGAVALLRLPLEDFGDGGDDASRRHYHPLPHAAGDGYAFQNRFVGDYVLYGTGTSWGRTEGGGASLTVASITGNGLVQLHLNHGVDRIEAMGHDAVVIGTDAHDLHFRAIELTAGARPALGDDYRLEGASQGETRSQAFYFKPEESRGWWSDGTAGVLGLPVARAARPGYRQLLENSAAMIFLRRAERRFVPLGEIDAHEDGVVDDACKASCVDWYGNARPIFLGQRTFALMGYEIVEGELGPRSIHETRRINFAPPHGERRTE